MVNEKNFEILNQKELNQLCEIPKIHQLFMIEAWGNLLGWNEAKGVDFPKNCEDFAWYLEKENMNELAEKLKSENGYEIGQEIIQCFYHYLQ